MLIAGGLVLLAALACLGLGLGVLRLAERANPGIGDGVTVGDLGILGYATLGLLATVLHVVMPLGGVPAAVACLAGIGLVVVLRRGLARQAGAFGWGMGATAVLLVAACLRLGAMIPGSLQGHFDTGLYHIQAVRQVMEFPLILGSANIHMRFGYNSAVFPTAGLLSGGLPGLGGALTTNAVLMAFVIVAVVQRALARADATGLRATIFGALAVLLTLFTPLLILRVWAGTPNSDIPSALMVLYGFHLALRLSDLGSGVAAAPERAGTAAMLAVVVALAVTLKLSALPVVLLAALPLLAWRRGALARRDIALGAGAALVIGLPWLARGIATSGCFAYPQPASCLPVPWRVGATVAQSDLDWMRAWARRPDTLPEVVLADWSWLPGWIASLPREPSWPVFVTLVGVLALMLVARLLCGRRLVIVADALPPASRGDILVLFGVAGLGIAMWFTTAPLVRYGQAWLVLPLLLAIAHCAPVGWRHSRAAGFAAVIARRKVRAGVALALGAATIASLAGHAPRRLFDAGPPNLPVVATEQRGDLAGLPIHVPVQGSQCWDAPRLCTPQLGEGVVARRLFWTWMVLDP